MTIRLNKCLADLGLCSRREADRIDVAAPARAQQRERVTIVLPKSVGYVSGQPEDGHPSAATLIRPQTRWCEDRSRRRFQPAHARGLAPAGRLDIDSTGLLVLTQDGRVAMALIGEHSAVWRCGPPRSSGSIPNSCASC